MNEEYVKYKEMILERMKIGLQVALSDELLSPSVTYRDDYFYDSVVFQVRGYVWAEQIEHHDVKYPADWWQAFKERWFNKWMLERWPVRYKIHHIDLKAVFPSLKIESPEYKYIIRAIENIT